MTRDLYFQNDYDHIDYDWSTEPGLYSCVDSCSCARMIVTDHGFTLFCVRCGAEVSK